MQKENDTCVMNNDLQKENSTKETIEIPNILQKENDTCVMNNDLQKENDIKETIEKDAASVELMNCMETKELPELAKNSDCTKEKELSKLMKTSRDGANGELMNCREANELPKLPTNSNPDPNFCPVASASKKSSRKKKKKEQMMLQKQSHPPDPLVVENKWPVLSSEPNMEPTGWPEFPLKPLKTPLSMEEQARAAASRLQQNGVRALHNFLKKDGSSNNDSEDEDDDGDEREEEAFQFFLGLFKRDTGLRIYYEKNYSNGEFYCLVCRGIGVKMGKTYRDCVGIVQHSTSSLKKWRKAHRGFGRAVCLILGWNIGKLPNIVQDLGESLGQSPVKPAAPQNDAGDEEVMILEHADAEAMDQMETKDIIDLSSGDSSEDGEE
ncbi:putative protein phosphatase 2C F42G9.1 [Iris pallida]|nr:putative protein phosphatase 2C F42G9.1 [Iris pallida]